MKKLKNILLVDDDEVTNFINAEIISELEISEKVEVCYNGKEAMDFLIQAADGTTCVIPELIFLDINMPVMDGFEFLAAYKEKFGKCKDHIIITMLTTSLRDEDMERARGFENVVNGYIEKPLTKTVVLSVIKRHFDK